MREGPRTSEDASLLPLSLQGFSADKTTRSSEDRHLIAAPRVRQSFLTAAPDRCSLHLPIEENGGFFPCRPLGAGLPTPHRPSDAAPPAVHGKSCCRRTLRVPSYPPATPVLKTGETTRSTPWRRSASGPAPSSRTPAASAWGRSRRST